MEFNYFTLWFLESLHVLGCGGLVVLICLWLVKLLTVSVCSCLHRYISSLVTESLSVFRNFDNHLIWCVFLLMVHFVRFVNFLLHLLLRGNKLIKNLYFASDSNCLVCLVCLHSLTFPQSSVLHGMFSFLWNVYSFQKIWTLTITAFFFASYWVLL